MRTRNVLGIRNEETKKLLESMVSIVSIWAEMVGGYCLLQHVKQLIFTPQGGRFPSECINENPGQIFLIYVLQNESTRLSMAYEALKSVQNIFKKDLSSTTWDLHQLNLFQNMIDRTVERLQFCVGEQLSGSSETKYANLKLYFEKLNGILEDKGHSRCAWEIVRMEVLRNLEYLSKFFGSSQR
uniref:Uncharacterized protein n=1 Tax=Paramormyrops kingsleyae TaxID=1676925 RepID=A0A3B3TF40_9TELE